MGCVSGLCCSCLVGLKVGCRGGEGTLVGCVGLLTLVVLVSVPVLDGALGRTQVGRVRVLSGSHSGSIEVYIILLSIKAHKFEILAKLDKTSRKVQVQIRFLRSKKVKQISSVT